MGVQIFCEAPRRRPGEGGGGEKGDGAKRRGSACTYMFSAAADAWTRSRSHVLDCLTRINKLCQPRRGPRAADSWRARRGRATADERRSAGSLEALPRSRRASTRAACGCCTRRGSAPRQSCLRSTQRLDARTMATETRSSTGRCRRTRSAWTSSVATAMSGRRRHWCDRSSVIRRSTKELESGRGWCLPLACKSNDIS